MKTGFLDVDSFFPAEWDETFGERVFRFDAFISHNWKDKNSDTLLSRLQGKGISAWHDRHQDIRDRRVLQKISSALSQSRIIVLCIGRGYQATPWCRAEYLNGLKLERRTLATRVIIAVVDEAANIPDELAAVPRFACTESSGFDEMVTYLRDQNRLPFDFGSTTVSAPLLKVKQAEYLRDECATWLKQNLEEDCADEEMPLRDLVLKATALTVTEEHGHRKFSHRFFAVRGILVQNIAKESRWPFSDVETKLLESAALLLADSANLDNRANAFMILQCLHECAQLPSTRAAVLNLLAHETDTAVLGLAHPWIDKSMASFTEAEWPYVYLAALRSPFKFNWCASPVLIQRLPEALRTRVLVSDCTNRDLLSIGEQLHLLLERAGYILSPDYSEIAETSFDRLLQVIGIPDFELLLRDFHDMMLGQHRDEPHDLGEAKISVYSGFVDVCERFATRAHESPDVIGLRDMEEWIMDYALTSLLLCSAELSIRDRARAAYSRICDVVEAHGALAREVPGYRNVLRDFEAPFDRRVVDRSFIQHLMRHK